MANKTVTLNNVRLASLALFTPTAYKPDDPVRYFLRGILEKGSDAHQALDTTIKEVLKEKHGSEAGVVYKKAKAAGKAGILDGDMQAGKDGFEGNVYFNAKNERAPGVFRYDPKAKKNVKVEDDGLFYPGCYADVQLNVYAWGPNKHGAGASCELVGVRFRSDGEALSTGGVAPDPDAFESIEDEAAPGADWDDDITF